MTPEAKLQAKLDQAQKLYPPDAPIQLRAEAEDVRLLLGSDYPKEFKRLNKYLADAEPTHILLTMAQIQILLNHVRTTKASPGATDVPRQPRARVDDQAVRGIDRERPGSDASRPSP